MTLQRLLDEGRLVTHEATRGEISHLIKLASRDLKACRTAGLDADWKLSIAYNAALQFATVALRAAGYRTLSGAHHYNTVHSLRYTLGLDSATVEQLDRFRQKRNTVEYVMAGAASEDEARLMLALAEQLKTAVLEWLRNNHPNLARK